MATKLPKQNMFVILPPRGTVTRTETSHVVKSFLTRLAPKKAAYSLKSAKIKNAKVKVYDSVHENGAKLVHMDPKTMASLKSTEPGIRVVPLVYYKKAAVPKATLTKKIKKASASSGGVTIKLISKDPGDPIADATVVAFTDFANKIGDDGKTNKSGTVKLALKKGDKIQRLYIYPEKNYWSILKKNITAAESMEYKLEAIDLSAEDSLRYFYKQKKLPAPKFKIKVGVLDTGSGPHPDLVISGGMNCVLGEDPKDYNDNGDGHGTHVAGIIGAHGKPPKGIRGVAPGVIINSYRIFGKNEEGATNFDIVKAIDKAVADGCDILNMSFGGGPADAAVQEAIADAFDKGTIAFVATGNDDRSSVSFPASYSLSIAVSAMGRKGLFPDGTTHADTIAEPLAKKDKNNFIASFSNFGPEVDFTGPGVAVISTVPGGYVAMDGTSMACPAATGIAARHLAANSAIMNSPRNQNRSVSMMKFLSKKAKQLGFGIEYEGNGLIR
jgi:subtilisin family serine protease